VHLGHDPVLAVLVGKLSAHRKDCAAVAGKSTLNRLELSRPEPTRYHKIAYDQQAIEELAVDLFLEAHARVPKQIIVGTARTPNCGRHCDDFCAAVCARINGVVEQLQNCCSSDCGRLQSQARWVNARTLGLFKTWKNSRLRRKAQPIQRRDR